MKKNFLDIHKDIDYKKEIIYSFIGGIGSEYKDSYKSLMEYVIDKKYHLFDREDFKGSLYSEEDEILDLVLPAVKRVFGNIFIHPPTIFNSEYNEYNVHRYKLFTMYFNADEFIDYLIDMFIESKDCLKHFEHIDRTAETLSIIVDNYIADLIKRVLKIENHQEAIDGLVKQLKREETLNEVLNNEKDEFI